MNKQSIMKSLRFARKLVNGCYRTIAPAESSDEVQTAVGIIDKMSAPTMHAFDEQHIVTVGTAKDMMMNDYWKTGSKNALVQAKDLKVIQMTRGSAYVQYHIIANLDKGTWELSCTMPNVADLARLVQSVKQDLGLEKDVIKIPEEEPF